MAVISISLSEENMESLENVMEHFGIKGRSEAIRATIKMAEADVRDNEALEGDVEGVLIIVHNTHDDQWMNKIQHKYESVIRTQLHSHLQNRKCLEVMIISTDAETLNRMMKDIHGVGKAEYIKFVKSR